MHFVVAKKKQVVNDCEMPFSIILVIVDPETNPPEQEELITAAAQLFYHLYADVYHVPQLLFFPVVFSSLSNLSAPVS
jgi:hypothetical protein